MSTAIFTGQIAVDSEFVICEACKDATDPIGLHSTAWWDSYVTTTNPTGAYVHYKCLSDQRKMEIKNDNQA